MDDFKFETLYDGKKIARMGLGTWNMGGGMSPNYSKDRLALEALQAALEMGYTHIDTAESYAAGHTEELVGQAIKDFDRQQLFITTKVSPSNLRYGDVHRAVKGSLKRLGTDYLDLYLIHWPSGSIPLDEGFRALNELVENGQVRYLGVSNFNLALLKQAESLSRTPIVTNQAPYSLRDRQYVKNGVLEYCQLNGILLTAYSPVKGGVLSDRTVRRIAESHGATPAQVALHWLIRQPKVITIPMSTNRKHLEENLAAVDLDLSEEEIDRLNLLI